MQVIQDFGVNGAFPSTVGGTGTAIKYFGRNAAFAAGATWTSPATPSSTSAAGAMIVPADLKLNGQLMEIVASGAFLPSAAISSSETVKVELYAVTGTQSSPTYTLLADINGGFAPGTDGIWYNFSFDVELQGNNRSGIVGGFYTSTVNNGSSGNPTRNNVSLQNSLTGISFGNLTNANAQPSSLGGPFGLVVGVTFGQSDAGNKAELYEFSISA